MSLSPSSPTRTGQQPTLRHSGGKLSIRLGRIDQRDELAVARHRGPCGSKPGRASGLRRGWRRGRRRAASGSRSSRSPEMPRERPQRHRARRRLGRVWRSRTTAPTNIPAVVPERLSIPLGFQHKLAPVGLSGQRPQARFAQIDSFARPLPARCRRPRRRPGAIRRSGRERLPRPAIRPGDGELADQPGHELQETDRDRERACRGRPPRGIRFASPRARSRPEPGCTPAAPGRRTSSAGGSSPRGDTDRGCSPRKGRRWRSGRRVLGS